MATCCGAKRCTCTVTAGPGVTVDGNGSSSTPYVISAGAATPIAVQAADTPTVDTTISGTGTAGDPYVVSGAVILDPSPPGGGSNLLNEGPEGLFVECAGVRQCFSAGDGASYDPATGVIEARLSADAGNTVAFGSDGGLYSAGGGGGTPTVVQAGADTPSVDVTVSGTGMAADPYEVTAAVILDPAPPGGGSNLLSEGPDGLYVECADVRQCFSAGDGAAYDPATGEISARPSTDAGNIVHFGTDGGLYATAPAAAPTVVQAQDTPTVDTTVTGNGTAANPYQVSAAVRLDPTPPGGGTNLLESGPEGLYVECADVRSCLTAGPGIDYDAATGTISAEPGAATVVEAGTGVTVTGTGTAADPYEVSAVPPETGCGLTGDGSTAAPLSAVVGAWPYAACDVDDYAGQVYCDSTGALRSEPRSTATYQQQGLDQAYPDTPVPGGAGDTPVEDRPFTVTNPDPCRPAFVIFEAELDIDFTLPPNSAALYAIGGDDMLRVENKSTQVVNDFHVQTTKVYQRVIPPGGTLVEPFVIGMGGNYNSNSTYSRIQTWHRAFIFNL